MNERIVVLTVIAAVCGIAWLSAVYPVVNAVVTALVICGFVLGSVGIAAHLVRINRISGSDRETRHW